MTVYGGQFWERSYKLIDRRTGTERKRQTGQHQRCFHRGSKSGTERNQPGIRRWSSGPQGLAGCCRAVSGHDMRELLRCYSLDCEQQTSRRSCNGHVGREGDERGDEGRSDKHVEGLRLLCEENLAGDREERG